MKITKIKTIENSRISLSCRVGIAHHPLLGLQSLVGIAHPTFNFIYLDISNFLQCVIAGEPAHSQFPIPPSGQCVLRLEETSRLRTANSPFPIPKNRECRTSLQSETQYEIC